MYWPEINVCQIIWRFVFSFLTLLFNLWFQKETKDTLYCLSVWNVVKDHLAIRDATALLPESECKGIAFSWTTKQLEEKKIKKTREKINYAAFSAQFSKLPFKNSKNHQNPCYFISGNWNLKKLQPGKEVSVFPLPLPG